MNSVHALLESAIDYAGIFPPASLGLEEAVRNYAAYRIQESSWALGRFIIPASKLEELRDCVRRLDPDCGEVWHLGVLLGNDLEPDFEALRRFGRTSGFAVDAVELRWPGAGILDKLAALFSNRQVYLEIPSGEDPRGALGIVAAMGARAKIRTGGVSADLFPAVPELARFLIRCADSRIAFKATAGLHHAVRSVYPLGYGASSPDAMMHGFLNVLLGSAAAHSGSDEEAVAEILRDEDRSAFHFTHAGIGWREMFFTNARLRDMRNNFLVSFGSCSFDEPLSEIGDLARL